MNKCPYHEAVRNIFLNEQYERRLSILLPAAPSMKCHQHTNSMAVASSASTSPRIVYQGIRCRIYTQEELIITRSQYIIPQRNQVQSDISSPGCIQLCIYAPLISLLGTCQTNVTGSGHQNDGTCVSTTDDQLQQDNIMESRLSQK
uniref:AlNc14C316G10529 protein n=1 Tax=Albugo laibachii Nc14 TaxID=890382 RepID=F0WW91_9STRA|nr:AlNc14C316G10529 [Albugo laibachii Nc14]|eukprot:CCA25711.1 AlNc14C316G10529 [Albugo laibachii Nc14]